MSNIDDHYVDCKVELKAKTPSAILVVQSEEEYWIPRSLLSWRTDRKVEILERNSFLTIQIMEWKADACGLEY